MLETSTKGPVFQLLKFPSPAPPLVDAPLDPDEELQQCLNGLLDRWDALPYDDRRCVLIVLDGVLRVQERQAGLAAGGAR